MLYFTNDTIAKQFKSNVMYNAYAIVLDDLIQLDITEVNKETNIDKKFEGLNNDLFSLN